MESNTNEARLDVIAETYKHIYLMASELAMLDIASAAADAMRHLAREIDTTTNNPPSLLIRIKAKLFPKRTNRSLELTARYYREHHINRMIALADVMTPHTRSTSTVISPDNATKEVPVSIPAPRPPSRKEQPGDPISNKPSSTLKPFPGYGDLMTIPDFTKACRSGLLTSDDGHGVYALENGYTDNQINCYDASIGRVNTNFTHVLWFNK